MSPKIVVVGLIVIALGCGACADSSAPPPNFVVVSTDWRSVSSRGNAAVAHGIFRNTGGPGSELVTFQDWQQVQLFTLAPGPDTCKVVIKGSAGELVEASCSMEVSDTFGTNQPPIAKVSP